MTAAAETAPRSSWSPVSLAGVVAGKRTQIEPSMMLRTDGQGLIYPGKTHSFHGESESGKSLILQAECVRLINDGQDVLYLDFEDDEASVVSRLMQLGAQSHDIVRHFLYVHPEVGPNSSEADSEAWESLLAGRYALVVLDGVTNCLSLCRIRTTDNDDLATWSREVPEMIARRTGAGVALADHVTKGSSDRGRYAIGGQAKMAALTGAAYIVEILDGPVAQGRRSVIDLRVAKDRPGGIRKDRNCGPFRKSDRTQRAATVTVDSTGPVTKVSFGRWEEWDETKGKQVESWRPTILMERISRIIEGADEPMTKTAACEQIRGKKADKLKAFDELVAAETADGQKYLERVNPESKTSARYRSRVAFRQDHEELLQRFSSGSQFPPKEGGGELELKPVPGN